VAVAAVELQARVDDAPLRLGAPVLRHRRLLGGQLARHVQLQAAVDERLRDLYLGPALGELEARVLERADRPPERAAVEHVAERALERAAGRGDRAHRDRHPLLREVLSQIAEAAALVAEELLR